ncbi:uncharacterized protein LOC100677861 [Nasonia vitripennis]|uniref:Uncharacterized protein n=1 Tax=Nasonia vitripennis TaxID=7425 RepID=A0A7M7GE48_NASVI|nr:uncharacterized protein LOC100677861 [Nasonia vitripennis]
MAEGRRDRSGRRKRRSAAAERSGRRASSDSELAQAAFDLSRGRREKRDKSDNWREKCHFHEGLDVDQLARYRRRRVESQPRDHLGPCAPDEDEEDEEEKRKKLVTEYRLAFRTSSDDVFRDAEGSVSPVRTKRHVQDDRPPVPLTAANTRASYHVFPLEGVKSDRDKAKPDSSFVYKTQNEIDFAKIMDMGTDVLKRPAPIRRGTTLRYEGDFSSATEYSNYVAHPGHHRSELRRRGTSLRMEGDFAGKTEKDDKFVEWPADTWCRPEPAKLPTHLKMEGQLQTSTECHDKYVPFVGARRPEILKQSDHLRLEGDSSWTPEYSDVFKEYDFVERRAPKVPESNLRPGGGFYEKTETTEFFSDPRDKEAELMAELAKDAEEEEEKKKKEEEERSRLKKEEEMKLLVSKLEDLKGPPLEIPEYKDAYKDFPRERPKLLKPEDEIGRADGSKVSNASPSHSRFKTKIDQDPEYKSIYLDPAKERPVYHRPPMSLRPSDNSSSRSSVQMRGPTQLDGYHYQRRDSRRSDAPLSEIRSQYVNYGQVPRVESLRMPANLRLEGNIDLEPEYRNAYGSTQDYRRDSHQSVQPNYNPKRRDRSLSASRRKDSNYWIDNDNRDLFGTINAAEDQDAFQVLQTRVHEESVVGKPPPGSKRNSRSSLARDSLDIDRSALRNNRSPSPSSYRLQVTHADEQPRGFARQRRSPSQNLQIHPSTDRSPSPIQQTAERPYSPSFARENSASHSRQQQAFVVLDNRDQEDELPRRRRTDRNYNPRESLTGLNRQSNGNVARPRNRTPPNWMPPWYDSSTSTI